MTLKLSSAQGLTTHVAIVMDRSGSMSHLAAKVVQVVDRQVADLARMTQPKDGTLPTDQDQEVRATVYTFGSHDQIEPIYFEKDVNRLPSIKGHYRISGMTALIDASLMAVNDLGKTSQIYGDHAFLIFVITDGQENNSRNVPSALRDALSNLGENWTVACLVPDQFGVQSALNLGFPPGNILEWDASSVEGLEKASRAMAAATTSYMVARSTGKPGTRGTKTLFKVDDTKLTVDAVKAANLKQLDQSEYVVIPVITRTTIKDFVEQVTTNYRIGMGYYQLNNSPTPKGKRSILVQGNKDIMVMEDATKKVFGGREARQLAGFSDQDEKVDPMNMGKENIVFIQSTSMNRILYPGTKFLLKTGAK